MLGAQLEVDFDRRRRSAHGRHPAAAEPQSKPADSRPGCARDIRPRRAWCHRRESAILGAENRRAPRIGRVVFPHLQQPRVDRLPLEVLVNLPRAAALENHAGNARNAVPDGEIGDRRPARQREDPVAFEDARIVAGEDLPDRDARHAVVDADVHLHLGEREDVRIGLRAVGRNQHARVGPGRRWAARRSVPTPRLPSDVPSVSIPCSEQPAPSTEYLKLIALSGHAHQPVIRSHVEIPAGKLERGYVSRRQALR